MARRQIQSRSRRTRAADRVETEPPAEGVPEAVEPPPEAGVAAAVQTEAAAPAAPAPDSGAAEAALGRHPERRPFGGGSSAWLDVEVSEDGQQATVTALCPGPETLDLAGLRAALEEQCGIRTGIDEEALGALLAEAQGSQVVEGRWLVARGTPPVPGVDGRLALTAVEALPEDVNLPYAALAAALAKQSLEEVLADDLLALLVTPGTKLAELVAATEGEPGVDVRGQPNSSPGKACGAEAGPHVSEKDAVFTAELVGYLHLVGGRVSVLPPIWVSPDLLAAHFVHFQTVSATPRLRSDWLQAALQACGVTFGMDEAAVEQLCAVPLPATEKTAVRIASGLPAQHGMDARVDYGVEMEKRAGQLLPDGSIDLRERNAAVGVTAEQAIGQVVPATPGVSGRNVKGEEIAARDGADRPFAAGENVRAETGEGGAPRFVAEIDGAVTVQGDTIHVRTVYAVSGDVNYDSGNIDVPGDVEIKGSVRSGFTVRAGGTVTVGGAVESGAMVHARGDVIVSKGIFGDRTRVVALGSVTTKFVQNSAVVAHGDISVGAYIINGQVRAGGRVRVESGGGSRGGSIVGGEVIATGGVAARLIGSAQTDRTLVGVGAAPEDAAAAAKLRQQATLLTRQAAKSKAALRISSSQDRDQVKRLLARTPADRLEQTEGVLKEVREQERQAAAAGKELEALEQRMKQALLQGRVRATERVFADVQVQFGNQVRNLDADVAGGCEFYRSGDGVRWRPLAGGEAPEGDGGS